MCGPYLDLIEPTKDICEMVGEILIETVLDTNVLLIRLLGRDNGLVVR